MIKASLSQLVIVAFLFGGCVAKTYAQAIVIQQPVLQQFGLFTTVTVPDRGSMQLGRVFSSSAGRAHYGLLPSVTSTGLQSNASSLDASVIIHDLEQLDRETLQQAAAALPAHLRQTSHAADSFKADVSPLLLRLQAERLEAQREQHALQILRRRR